MLQQQQLSECFCSKEGGGDLHFCDIFERPNLFYDIFSTKIILECSMLTLLTADAWVSGPDLEPQKMILSQKFRLLMRCKKYTINKICLLCLVSEIQLNFAQKCKQTAVSQKLSMVNKTYFLHLMRCLNVWESIIFWGARSGSHTHASAVKLPFETFNLKG